MKKKEFVGTQDRGEGGIELNIDVSRRVRVGTGAGTHLICHSGKGLEDRFG